MAACVKFAESSLCSTIGGEAYCSSSREAVATGIVATSRMKINDVDFTLSTGVLTYNNI